MVGTVAICFEQFVFLKHIYIIYRLKYGKSLNESSNIMNRVENNVAKIEIVHYEPFLFWPQCFQQMSAEDPSSAGEKRLIMG